nr:hypothetical protein [uncultured Pseudomonas sp.]
MALQSPYIRRLRSEEDVANDTVGATPPRDRFEKEYRAGNLGRAGAAIARTLSNFNAEVNRRTAGYYPDIGERPQPRAAAPVAATQSTPVVRTLSAQPAQPAAPRAPTARAMGAVDTSSPPARGTVASNGGGGPGSSGSAAPPPTTRRLTTTNTGQLNQTYRTGDGRTGILPLGVSVTRDARGNPAFGATGESVAQAERAAGVAPATSFQRTLAPAPARIATGGGGQAQAASIGIPGEEERRLENAVSGALFRTARNRGQRAQQEGLVRGLFDQYGQRQQIAADANRAQLQANTDRAIESQRAATALEAAALGRDADLQRAQLEADTQRELGRPDPRRITRTLTGGDGTTVALSEDGTVRTLRDEAGRPIRGVEEGAVTPRVQYETLAKEREGLVSSFELQPASSEDGKVDPRTARLQEIDQQMAALANPTSAATNAARKAGVPAGYQLVGTKDGKNVYRDASGKTFIEE